MKLRELGAKLYASTNGTFNEVEKISDADFVIMLCPGCLRSGERTHSLTLRLKPPGTHWTPEGTTIDDLTFIPRKVGGTSVLAGCTPEIQWHGWILDGEAVDWKEGD